MIRYIKKKLFGEWNKIKCIEGRLERIPYGIWQLKEEKEGVYVLEENSKTGDRRAYFEEITGEQTFLSVVWVEQQIKKQKDE